MLRRERWAGLVDSETESNAESDAAAVLPQPCEHSLPEADGQDWNTQPGQEGRCMPFLVLLGAYVRGLLQVRGSRDSMVWLQRTLQQDARARCLRRFLVPDLVFWISFDPAVVRGHVAASPRLAPCVSGSFSCNLNASGAHHAVPGMLFLSGGSNFERAEVVLFVAVVEKAA